MRAGHRLAHEAATLAAALAHKRTPWLARIIAFLVVAYAVSPIDFIPNFIPWLGQLDDLLIIGFGAAIMRRLVPDDVWQECSQTAATTSRRVKVAGAIMVLAVWALLVWLVVLLLR